MDNSSVDALFKVTWCRLPTNPPAGVWSFEGERRQANQELLFGFSDQVGRPDWSSYIYTAKLRDSF